MMAWFLHGVMVWCRQVCGLRPEVVSVEPLPDYLNDLNAMHEAEKVLTADQWFEYDRLMPLRDPQKIHATAAQRAEAFIKTLGLNKKGR
jgi:hypothetical protein